MERFFRTLFVFASIFLIVLMANRWIADVDLERYFRPAAEAVLRGESPFTVEGYFNAPWFAWWVALLIQLPPRIAHAVWLTLSLHLVIWLSWYFSDGRWLSVILITTSAPVLTMLVFTNNDWVALAAYVLPPWLGLPLAVIKPQVGVGYVIWQAWRYRRAPLTFLRACVPLALLTAISFALYGFWPLIYLSAEPPVSSRDLGVVGLALGLIALAIALRRDDVRAAMAASPLLAPFVNWHTWSALLIALARRPAVVAVLWVVMWVLFLSLPA